MANTCEFEFMEYTDEDSIDSDLICSICHQPFKDPVCTPCDHSYGRACILHWLEQKENCSCPICPKQLLLIEDLTPANRPLRNMLDKLRVRCTLCEQTDLQRGNFVDHIDKYCPKAMVQCQAADIRCPWKGLRDELHQHTPVCIFEPLRPVLGTLIAENQLLISEVHKHDNEIKELTKKISQLNNVATPDSGDESDGDNSKEENAIFIRNLPSTVKFNDLFDLFSKVGRIKFNTATQKSDIFTFKNPNRKDGFFNAKVVYADKESAAAAVAEYNNKQIPQWNTRSRLQVTISEPKRRNFNDFRKGNNEENVGVRHEAKATEDDEKALNKDEKIPSIIEQPQAPKERNRKRPHNFGQGDKSTN